MAVRHVFYLRLELFLDPLELLTFPWGGRRKRPERKPVEKRLVGTRTVVSRSFTASPDGPARGAVLLFGEPWEATSLAPAGLFTEGSEVTVVEAKGLNVRVASRRSR